MSKVLVFCESANGSIKSSSLELITAAKNSGLETVTCLLGSDAPTLAASSGNYGATSSVVCSDASLDAYWQQNLTLVSQLIVQVSNLMETM